MVQVDRLKFDIATIKYRGIFDIDGLFKTIYSWLIEQGYEVYEKKYKHKVPDPRGAEDEVTMSAYRKVTEYVRNTLDVDFHMWDMKQVDVLKDGVKRKMVSARIKIQLTPTVELDYTKRFAGNAFVLKLQDFYHKYIIKGDIQNYWEDELYYRTLKLHRVIKDYLEMETKTNASEGRW